MFLKSSKNDTERIDALLTGVHFPHIILGRSIMQIGEVALATGLSRDTLRYYEKRGLLRSRRSVNGYRDYPPETVDWLNYIRTAQTLGFTLQEIETGLPLLDAPENSALVLREVLAAKLLEIDQRIAGLTMLRGALAQRLEEPMAECPLARVGTVEPDLPVFVPNTIQKKPKAA